MIGNGIETARLLVVSRDSAVLRLLCSMGESGYWQLESAANVWEAMERLQSGVTPDLLLLDLPHGDADGLYMLRWLRRLRPALPIILLGHPDDAGKKQEALRLGARDYLVRPLDDLQLEMAIRHHLSTAGEGIETDITGDEVELIGDDTFFIGISPIMRELRAQTVLLAEANVPVLILGEGGSGKETIARLVHKLSVRSGFEFAKVNCAALPSDLLERELFGYGPNGTTTPLRPESGKMELCAKGTILLDEITEMPMGVQTNLLRVLQEKRFIRPGTSVFVEADVRVLAASTTNMEFAISKNRLSRRSLPPLERLHDSSAPTTGAYGGASAPVAPLHAPTCQAIRPPSARVFAGNCRGLPGIFLAGQPARVGKLCQTLPHGRQPGTRVRQKPVRSGREPEWRVHQSRKAPSLIAIACRPDRF